MQFANSRRDPSPPPNFSYEDMRGPGVISRPDLRYSQLSSDMSDNRMVDPSLRRSISTDTGREFIQNSYIYQNGANLTSGERGLQQHSIDHQALAHKFGSLPSLSSQMANQRVQTQGYDSSQLHGLQRHQRSLSQPGPLRPVASQEQFAMQDEMHNTGRRSSDYGAGISSQRLPPSMDSDYGLQVTDPRYSQSQPQGSHIRSMSGDGQYVHGRSMSMSHQTMSSGSLPSHGGHGQRRSSLQVNPTGNLGFYGGQGHPQGMHSNLQRRDHLDFVPGQSRFNESGVPVVASSDELRIFSHPGEGERMGNNNFPRHERMVSPAHSPLHVNYGSHSRNPSDLGSTTMSSSPMSLGSSGVVSLSLHLCDVLSFRFCSHCDCGKEGCSWPDSRNLCNGLSRQSPPCYFFG